MALLLPCSPGTMGIYGRYGGGEAQCSVGSWTVGLERDPGEWQMVGGCDKGLGRGLGLPGGFLSLTCYSPGKEIVGREEYLQEQLRERLAGLHVGSMAMKRQSAIGNDHHSFHL